MLIHYHLDAFTLVIICSIMLGVSNGQLRVGFYSETCPTAESIVQRVVQNEFSSNPQQAPRVLRLFFHDCFVEGCDGSILLGQFGVGERGALPNLGLNGFDVINKAKEQLEAACPGVVSCADVVSLAARDAIALTGGPNYEVPTGRRDGRISETSLAKDIPVAEDSIELLKSKFNGKGISEEDFVLLSAGGHSIGTVACFFVQRRVYNFTENGGSDPAIDPQLLPQLKSKCPQGGNIDARVPLDWSTETTFDDQILRNIRNGFAVLSSDARLNDDSITKRVLDFYIASDNSSSFKADFGKAMVKMGNIGVKTGSDGEIRRVCNAIN
ncbi:hypothetical protein K2173_026829 [Erythroxylum novogranatense]|uniref:Peroxidase n=1 Tax=Erythroxylum novogranatense TaxID=1862640 RepID=A0AAV8TX64_9ROSI|nr:hypothetical protein K2173_026829 [Erythroxylum novogranatense]